MKVLDLQCAHGHTFEGWFASEDDFLSQCERSLVQCPLCGDSSVVKKLSAPRLHLAARGAALAQAHDTPPAVGVDQALTTAWLAIAKQLIANTTDVGNEFVQEARKMHYGETEARAIRGQASAQEVQSLVEDGIDVVPFVLPEALKGPLQ